MSKTLCMVLSLGVVAGMGKTAHGTPGPAALAAPTGTFTKAAVLTTTIGPQDRSRPRRASTPFWVLVASALLSCLLSMAIRKTSPWAVALITSGVLATVCLLLTRPLWTPAAVALPAVALAAVLAVRYRLKEHVKPDDSGELLPFMTGLFLSAAAVYLYTDLTTGWTRNLVYVLLAFASLVVFLWKVKRPLMLWLTALAVSHLGYAAIRVALDMPSMTRGLAFIGGGMAACGLLSASVRQGTLNVILSAELVVLGACVAMAGTSGGLLNTQVGWTVALGLPLVQLGLGLTLAQKLGPGTLPQKPGEEETK